MKGHGFMLDTQVCIPVMDAWRMIKYPCQFGHAVFTVHIGRDSYFFHDCGFCYYKFPPDRGWSCYTIFEKMYMILVNIIKGLSPLRPYLFEMGWSETCEFFELVGKVLNA